MASHTTYVIVISYLVNIASERDIELFRITVIFKCIDLADRYRNDLELTVYGCRLGR